MRKKHFFKNLKVWQKARILVSKIYRKTQSFPKEETFGLRQQMRRCAVSIPSNIAEGCGRGTDPQLVNFLNIALGSANELETQIYLSQDLKFFEEKSSQELLLELNEVQKMIIGYRNSL